MNEIRKIKIRETSKLWRKNNPEKSKKRSLDWAKENPERIRMIRDKCFLKKFPKCESPKDALSCYMRYYYKKNTKKIRERVRSWREKNKLLVRQYRKKYKNNKRGSGNITIIQIKELYNKNIIYNGSLTCGICGFEIKYGDEHLDHKIPLSRGGSHSMENIWLVHSKCNLSKSNKTVEEYLRFKNGALN